MTPGARVAAAIDLLEQVRAGAPAEKVLTNWARASRYAGSGDRAAVRDLVFDVLRRRRSCAVLGGSDTARGLVLGALRAQGRDIAALFSGQGHAPAPLTAAEAAHLAAPVTMPQAEAQDLPDWIVPAFRESLGEDFAAVAEALRHRAPVFLRTNIARGTRDAAAARLAAEGIGTRGSDLADTALEVVSNPRAVQRSSAFAEGLVEVQDAASQAAVAALPIAPGQAVLDFCAGGGGKALAMAARGARVLCHDADPRRMADIPRRAARAGLVLDVVADAAGLPLAGFGLVLADAPCSGSGAWRRSPEARWRLTPQALADLQALQDRVLAAAAAHVAPGGLLAYATCSVLAAENGARIAAFLQAHPGWRAGVQHRWSPAQGCDGFFLALLHAPSADGAVAAR